MQIIKKKNATMTTIMYFRSIKPGNFDLHFASVIKGRRKAHSFYANVSTKHNRKVYCLSLW